MTLHAGLLVETLTNGPFAENCFLVADAETRRGVVIDPGDEEQRILQRVRQLELSIEAIVNTHAHVDHVGAVAPLKRLLGVPFALHPGDNPVLASLPMVAPMFGLPPKEVPEVERELADGDEIEVGRLRATVRATPGHSPGGCCFYFAEQKTIFVGDTLFAGSIGRTDLPGGDHLTLLRSIHDQLLSLDDDVVAYCGHGPSTTIGRERATNPFLR
jgi:glyoxylase-like metal-dependent hydrolase (beta-lactamase superfamily II)